MYVFYTSYTKINVFWVVTQDVISFHISAISKLKKYPSLCTYSLQGKCYGPNQTWQGVKAVPSQPIGKAREALIACVGPFLTCSVV